jgi:hypothetical protein
MIHKCTSGISEVQIVIQVVSDEYCFLSYLESLKETPVYLVEIEKEELIERYTGTVIAKCADGDVIIINNEGSVKRISHETMAICESWDTFAQFFFECLADA